MTNQNWSRYSFPMPLNTGSFTEFAMLSSSRGGGGVGDGVSGGVRMEAVWMDGMRMEVV